jgi:hypothetical protein
MSILIHFIVNSALIAVNTLFIGRASYLIVKHVSPSPGDFVLRRLSALFWPLTLLTALVVSIVTKSHNRFYIFHNIFLILPLMLSLVFLFFRAFKKRHPLMHPVLQYLSLVISYLFLILYFTTGEKPAAVM